MDFGIDAHKGFLRVSAIDERGVEVAAAQLANTPPGHSRLLGWARGLSGGRRFGIEGSGFYGHALARFLAAAGEQVFEVPGALTAAQRRSVRRLGKDDVGDALAIARVLGREGAALPRPRLAALQRDLKLLLAYRQALIGERTRTLNRLHADLVILRPGYHQHTPALTSKRALHQVQGTLAADPSLHAQLARQRIHTALRLSDELRASERQLRHLVDHSHSRLVTVFGIGPFGAARFLADIGDARRYPTRDHFASATGTCPIPASSGQTQRHRLNRGGNRQLNRVLHMAALSHASHDPRSRAYLARQRAAGKTKREALRCLKRRLSDVVYRAMLADTNPLDT